MWPAPVRQTRWVGRATEIRHRPRNRGSKPAAMGRDRKGPDTQASRRGSPASRGRCPPPARERELDAPYGAASRAAVQAFSDATSLAPPLQIRSIIVIPRTGMSAAGRGAQTATLKQVHLPREYPCGRGCWGRSAWHLRGLTQGTWSIAPKGLVDRLSTTAVPIGRHRGSGELPCSNA